MGIVTEVYKVCSLLPDHEKFGLISQLSRCSISIPSNIAEGSGKTSNKQFSQYLDTSIGSAYELETQLILVCNVYDIDTTLLQEKVVEIQRMISSFQRQLSTRV